MFEKVFLISKGYLLDVKIVSNYFFLNTYFILSKKINTLTVVISILILVGWYYDMTSLYYLIPIAIIYLVVNIVGSSNIQLDYFFKSYCSSSTTKKEIAITFDDGPHHEITPKLLGLLNSQNVNATFFCIGKKAQTHPEIVSEIIKNGHQVSNHSYSHDNLFDLFSSRKMQKEIKATNQIITSIIGKSPLLFRPPYGVTNPMLSKALRRTNMVSVGWSLRSFDTVKDSKNVIAKLVTNTKPGDIVLFHDTNMNTLEIVEEYLMWLKKNNFKIVSLTSLLNIEAYED